MTQADLDRAVASATGESLDTIRHLRFVPLTSAVVEIDRPPLVLDWDEQDLQRLGLFP